MNLAPFLVVPTYHEVDNLPEFTRRIWAAVPEARLLLVDDASNDGTPAWVKAHALYGKQLFILERPGKMGLSSAYLQGFRWAIDFHARQPVGSIVQMDADLSHDPAAIPDFLQALDQGADLVLATRYRGGIRVRNWPLFRLALSLGAAQYVKLCTGMGFSDPTGGFKAFRPDKLAGLNLAYVKSDGYAFQIEVTYLAWRQGWKIVEVPITFEDRQVGHSKMSFQILGEAIWRVPWLTVQSLLGLRKK